LGVLRVAYWRRKRGEVEKRKVKGKKKARGNQGEGERVHRK